MTDDTEPLLSPELVKTHIRLTRDDEDDYLALLTQAAIAHFEDHTGRTLVSYGNFPDKLKDDEVPLYASITWGLLLLIGHWYENRELTTEKPLSQAPATTYDLWAPFVFYHLGDAAP